MSDLSARIQEGPNVNDEFEKYFKAVEYFFEDISFDGSTDLRKILVRVRSKREYHQDMKNSITVALQKMGNLLLLSGKTTNVSDAIEYFSNSPGQIFEQGDFMKLKDFGKVRSLSAAIILKYFKEKPAKIPEP